MNRLHLVELEDQPWFPTILRDGGTAYLELAVRLSGHARLLAPLIRGLLDAAGEDRIVDLCSGGGGPVREVVRALAEEGRPVRAHLTDFFPNLPALERAAAEGEGRVTFERRSVDARAVPADLEGVRTIFNAFHHFQPEDARKILEDAVRARRPIAVVEVVSREVFTLAALVLTIPLAVTLSMPAWRPFRWQWLVWTWLIPVMQPFVMWDGVVSWLRIYSEDELRALIAGIDAPDWEWQVGRIRLGDAPAHATYLTGRPLR